MGRFRTFLVLACSESIFTDITEYTYFSLRETSREFKYENGRKKMSNILYHLFLFFGLFYFCQTHFVTHQRFVANPSAISPFLGRVCYDWLIKKFIFNTCLSAQIPHASKYHERRGCHARARASRARLFFQTRTTVLSLEKVSFFTWKRLFVCFSRVALSTPLKTG